LGSREATGGPPRGVDVKPPSREGPGSWKMAKKADFPEKCPKSGILAKNAHFGLFGGFLGPWALPGTRSPRGFYINPSRRGPAVPAGGTRDGSAAQARGTPPEEGVGGLPLGRRSGGPAARGWAVADPPVKIRSKHYSEDPQPIQENYNSTLFNNTAPYHSNCPAGKPAAIHVGRPLRPYSSGAGAPPPAPPPEEGYSRTPGGGPPGPRGPGARG